MPAGSSGIFYGWVVVAAAFLTMFTCFGAAYSFPAFFEPLSREFGATRGTISLVFSTAGFLYFALGAISGRLADRIGPQPVVGFGLACVAAGMFAASFADSLTAIIIFYGVGIGIGVGFAYVPAIGTVQRWFVAKRGQASGWAVAGIGIGTMAATGRRLRYRGFRLARRLCGLRRRHAGAGCAGDFAAARLAGQHGIAAGWCDCSGDAVVWRSGRA
jgi:MFS family permease